MSTLSCFGLLFLVPLQTTLQHISTVASLMPAVFCEGSSCGSPRILAIQRERQGCVLSQLPCKYL